MKHILIINGFPMVGKDTFIDILTEISLIPIFRYSSIDYIKQVAIDSFGYKDKKDLKGRALLAGLKDVSTKYNNLPFKKIVQKEESISTMIDSFIYCVCCREPEEIKKMVDYYTKEGYNLCTIQIIREDVDGQILSNSADEGVNEYYYDRYLKNDGGKEDFKKVITNFYKLLIRGRYNE